MRTGKINRELNHALAGNPFILCICEGAAEKAIVDLLLDHGLLRFAREDLVESEVTMLRKAKDIEERFLNRDFEDRGLVIFRVLDSKRENLRLRKQYADQYEVFNFYTRPEIEMLHILACSCLDEFRKSGEKPSTFFKGMKEWKNCRVKSEEFVRDFYSDTNMLIRVITEYNKKCGQKEELNLYDLLTEESVRRAGGGMERE